MPRRTAANDIPRGSARSSCTPAPAPAARAGSCLRRRSRSRAPLRRRVVREVEPRAEEEADAAEEDAASASPTEEGPRPSQRTVTVEGGGGRLAFWGIPFFRQPCLSLSCDLGSVLTLPVGVGTWERENGRVEAAWELITAGGRPRGISPYVWLGLPMPDLAAQRSSGPPLACNCPADGIRDLRNG
nr:unnamed protein product [Digitaria exilis]